MAGEKMAARKRTGNENGVLEGPRTEDSMRESRRARRVEIQTHQRRLEYIRWGLVLLALLLLAVGLYYYLTNVYQPVRAEVRGGTEAGGKKVSDKTTKQREMRDTDKKKTTDKQKKTENKSKAKSARTGDSGDGKKRKKETGEKKASTKQQQKSTKPKSKRDVPTISMSDVRLLRRPILAGDADRPYIIEILNGDNLLLEERYSEALEKFNEILKMFPQSPRGLFGKGETLSGLAEQKSSNKLLNTAIEFYQDTADSFLATKDLKTAALARLADLHQKRGKHAAAIATLEKLYSLDSEDLVVANRLGAAYIRTGNNQMAENHFKKLLNETPDNFYAKANLGYLLFSERQYESALPLLMEGLRRDKSIQRNGRFYLYAGEALSRLNRSDEAQVLYSEAVSRDLFPSLYQRSLFNEPDLRAKPWWSVSETGYETRLQPLLNALDNISSEVIPALLGDANTPPTSFTVFSHGKKNAENCMKIPHTCSLLESIPEATTCKHGEVKFMVVPPRTHVPPHTGNTNTRLEVLVGLNLGEGELSVRLGEETRVLREGEVMVYDDSFEREVWFSSLRPGLVLSMDVWHPDLSLDRRRRLIPFH